MKKQLLTFLLFLACGFAPVYAQTVYITNTGNKYHTATCHYLAKSKQAIALNEALEQGYVACKVCKPAQTLQAVKPAKPLNTSPDNTPAPNAAAVQCSATTKAGARCKRMTKSTNGKCWQHGGD